MVSFTNLVLYIAIVHLTIKNNNLMIPERFRAVPGVRELGGARAIILECLGCPGSIWEVRGGSYCHLRHPRRPAAASSEAEVMHHDFEELAAF